MASADKKTPLRAPFARDEPVALELDAFGHADYVRALGSIVTDDTAPSTVGVFGPWGVGKSTIVEGLPSVLPKDTAYAYFDAWRYEEDSLRRQFLRDCTSQLDASGQLSDFNVEENLAELDVDTQTVKEGLGLSWRNAIRAGIFGLLVGAGLFVILTIGVLTDFIKESNTGNRFAVAVAAALVGILANLLNQIIVVTETTVTRRSLQDPDRFADRFAALLGAVKPGRLVIVVDNLDRCAPGKAVEMLSTIKTYLEPTVRRDRVPASRSQQTVKKQVTFVVSVDDEALRRHLVAQEMQRSQTTSDEDQARKYVDEYLAKFFNARLPIRPVLPDDIRHYIRDNLDPLIKARGVDEQDARALVSLVATGLRRNPRQVKQFINDLESRLRLLQERETAHGAEKPGVSPPVSGEVVMIAKLALLESEFPREFDQLLRRHRKLDEWQASADSNPEVWIDQRPEKSSPTQEEQAHAEAFASFLQASRSIHTENLRALLHLKQAREEAGLPGFQQFRDAVVNEDQPEVERLIGDASPEERRGYAERMPQILRDELDQGYSSAARAAVRMMIAVADLADFKDQRIEVLETALNDPTLRDNELVFLDPGALARAAQDLSPTRQKELLGTVVTRFAGEGKTPEERQSAAEALSPYVALLSVSDRERIKSALQQDDLRSAFDLYVPLARADAGLLPAGVARAALEELAKPDENQRSSLVGREAAFAVATVALKSEANADLDQLAIDRVIESADGTREDSEAFGGTITRAIQLLTPLVAAPDEQWTRLADHIRAQWPNYPREHDKTLLELTQLAMSRAPGEERTNIANNLAPMLFQDPAGGVSLIAKAKDSLLPELKLPVAEQLTLIGSGDATQRHQAASLIHDLDPDNAGTRIAQLVTAAVQQNEEESATRLLDEQAVVLSNHRGQLAADLLGWADSQLSSGGRVPYTILGHLTPGMAPEQLVQLSQITVRQLSEGNDEATQALDDYQRLGATEALSSIVAQAADTLEGAETLAEGTPTAEVLQRIAKHLASASDADQVRVSNKLQTWLNALDQRPPVFAAVRRIQGLRAEAANPLVGKLLEASGQEVTTPLAVQALLAADAIAGGKSTRARRRLDAHLKNLEEGSDEDRAIAREFREARGT